MTDEDTAEQLADVVDQHSRNAGRDAAIQLQLEQEPKAHARQTMAHRARLAALDFELPEINRRTDRLATLAFAAMGVGLAAFIIGVAHVLWAH